MVLASKAGGMPGVVSKQALEPNCLLKKELDFLGRQIKPIPSLQHLPKGSRHRNIARKRRGNSCIEQH